MLKNYVPAGFFIEQGMRKPTFFQRVTLRKIKFHQIPGGQRLYSLADWNKKCPDKTFDLL
jgi:hypothetical protein